MRGGEGRRGEGWGGEGPSTSIGHLSIVWHNFIITLIAGKSMATMSVPKEQGSI